MVIVKTVLVWNLASSSWSSSLNSYKALLFFRDPVTCNLNDGAIMLGRVCFSDNGNICRGSMLAAPPNDSSKSECWPS